MLGATRRVGGDVPRGAVPRDQGPVGDPRHLQVDGRLRDGPGVAISHPAVGKRDVLGHLVAADRDRATRGVAQEAGRFASRPAASAADPGRGGTPAGRAGPGRHPPGTARCARCPCSVAAGAGPGGSDRCHRHRPRDSGKRGASQPEADLQEARPEADLVMGARDVDARERARWSAASSTVSSSAKSGRCHGTVASPSRMSPVRARFHDGHSRSMNASSMIATTSSDSSGTSCQMTSSGAGR